MSDNLKAKELCLFQIRQQVSSIYKYYLSCLEDLYIEHQEILSKINASLPDGSGVNVEAVDSFTENKFKHLRKRVLDYGNDAIRGLSDQILRFKIDFQ
jgi:hypothetical protein